MPMAWPSRYPPASLPYSTPDPLQQPLPPSTTPATASSCASVTRLSTFMPCLFTAMANSSAHWRWCTMPPRLAAGHDAGYGKFLRVSNTPIHVYALPLHRNGQLVGTLALVHDATYIDRQVAHTVRDSLVSALVQTLLITGLALVLVRWTLTGPLTRTAKWLRTLRTGQSHAPPSLPEGELFDQLHHEVTHLARDLSAARATAEEEARLRNTNASLWTAERLRVSLSHKLKNKPLFVIANREP